MEIESRIQFADSYFSKRQGFMPGFMLEPSDPITGKDRHPDEPHLLKLKRRELFLSGSSVLRGDNEIDFALSLVFKDKDSKSLSLNIVQKIRTETNSLDVLDEVSDLFKANGLDKTITTQWEAKRIVNGEQVAGFYDDKNRIIGIRYIKPDGLAVISMLAKRGGLPMSHQTLTHEQTHALQHNLVPGQIVSELIEAQAYQAEQHSLALRPHKKLVNDVIGSKVYRDLDSIKFNSAVWFIDRFNALGLTQKEIIEIIKQPGKWNSEEGIWDNIENTLQETMVEKGVDKVGLERAVMAGDLINAINRHLARIITQEELYQAYKTEIEERREKQRIDDDQRRRQNVRIALLSQQRIR